MQFLEWAESKPRILAGHNVQFDNRFLRAAVKTTPSLMSAVVGLLHLVLHLLLFYQKECF